MPEENIAETLDTEQLDGSKGAAKRQRSSIAFPYMDLDEAVGVAVGIQANVGSGNCSVDQLGPWLKQSPTSSAFRIRLNTARLFGLVDTEKSDAIHLTDLGRMVVDPKREKEARAKAFLTVPLYRAVYEKMKGGVVPPAAAFERELVSLGVADSLKDRARPVLERSAEQAGFYEAGRDRLVQPGFAPAADEPFGGEAKGGNGGPGGSGGGGGDGTGVTTPPPLALDLLLLALLQKIPPKAEGWPAAKRARWFRAFAMNVSQVFDEEHEPVELTITVAPSSDPNPSSPTASPPQP